METQKREIIIRWCWGICLVLLWTCAVLLFVRVNGHLSAQDLLRYQPENKALAVLAMCGLFLLKSVDFLIYSGLLYSISGIMFSFPAAVCVNLIGIVIMSVVPYFAGRSLGRPVLKRIQERYPKFQEVENFRSDSVFVLTFLLRCVGLPYNIVGLYIGARECPFLPYLLGSVLGLAPKMVAYTVMGNSAANLRSPAFLAAVAAEVILCVLAFLLYRYRIRRARTAIGPQPKKSRTA